MPKKIFFFILSLVFFNACSNTDPKKEFFNDSIVIEVEFDTLIESFSNGFLDISIWKQDKRADSKSLNLIRDIIVKDIKHKEGKKTIKKYLLNLEEPFEPNLNYFVILKVYKDSNQDGEMEVVHGKSLRDDRGEIDKDLKEVRFFIR